MKDKLLTVLFAIAAALLILSFSIGLPIYFRPFYYMQIESLEIPEVSGEDIDTIKEAYNELLDYLTFPGTEFGTGEFEYTESGKAHFVDCKFLFMLDFWVFIASLVTVATLIILVKRKVFQLCLPFGFHPIFVSAVSILLLFAIVAALVAVDFDSAFTVFHMILFPGKTNWYFNWYEDEIIRILPEEFFMNCAILIFASIVILCIGAIVFGIVEKKRRNIEPRVVIKTHYIDFSKDGFDVEKAIKSKEKSNKTK